MGNVHIGKYLPYGGCSILDSSGKGFVCLMAGFWGFLQLICHILYSWIFSGLCAAYDHSSYGHGYRIKVHGPGRIISNDSTSADTGNSRCYSSNSWYVSRGFSTWSCGSWCFHIGYGVDENSGWYRRSAYQQCAGGWECWYGRSSWQAGRRLSWNEWGGSAPWPGHPSLPGNSNGNRSFLLPLSWGIQHLAEYGQRGWQAAIYRPIHFKTWHNSLKLSAKGQTSRLTGRWTFAAQYCKHRQ